MKIFTFLVTLGGVCPFFVCGASAVETDSVSLFVMEGNAVTLHTGVEMNQKDRMTWFCGDNRIALINGDQNKICTDDQCKERFTDRLKLDLQTGSLTIMNINTTDSGDYKLKITSRNIEKIFSVTVHGVSAAKRDEMKRKSVKEGESFTLDPDVSDSGSSSVAAAAAAATVVLLLLLVAAAVFYKRKAIMKWIRMQRGDPVNYY